MEDIESTPLVAKTADLAHPKASSTKYTFLAVALLISLGLIAVFSPSASRALSMSPKSMNFEVALSEKEDLIFKLADVDADMKVTQDEVRSSFKIPQKHSHAFSLHVFICTVRLIDGFCAQESRPCGVRGC